MHLYIQAIRQNKEACPEAYHKITEVGHAILGDFSWAMATTIKQKKYQQITRFENRVVEIDPATEIAGIALQLSYEDAIKFMGELAGAWILTYPIDAIKKYEK